MLKGLSHDDTGSFVAAATTSLPEWIGGNRNWDYRYCWLRDATFTLVALLKAGCGEDARLWRDWLVRAIAGDPSKLQIMYGVAGERRLPELELPWLAGFEGSSPVRIGNGAADQLQLDVFGEVMDALHQARLGGLAPDESSWHIQQAMMEWLEGNWHLPDEGIWEVRGSRSCWPPGRSACSRSTAGPLSSSAGTTITTCIARPEARPRTNSRLSGCRPRRGTPHACTPTAP